MRLNHIVMSGVVPFNFGMTVDDWQEMYDRDPHDSLLGGMTDPCTWSDEQKAACDARAARENAIVDDLMTCPAAEFDARLDAYLAQTPPD